MVAEVQVANRKKKDISMQGKQEYTTQVKNYSF